MPCGQRGRFPAAILATPAPLLCAAALAAGALCATAGKVQAQGVTASRPAAVPPAASPAASAGSPSLITLHGQVTLCVTILVALTPPCSPARPPPCTASWTPT